MWDDEDDLSAQSRRNKRSSSEANILETQEARTTMPTGSLPVNTFRDTYDLPPDAADRILMETARTVLGIETLLEVKVAELSQAVQSLAETEISLATEMRDRLDEGASRIDADYSAQIMELKSVIKSLTDVVSSLSAIRSSVIAAETRLQDWSKARHEAMLATSNRHHEEALQRINTATKSTLDAVSATHKSSMVQEETLQRINTATKSTLDAVSATHKSLMAQTELVQGALDKKLTLTEGTLSKRLEDVSDIISQQIIGTNNGLIKKVDYVYEAALAKTDKKFADVSEHQYSDFIVLRKMLILMIIILIILLSAVGFTLFTLLTRISSH